MLINFHNHSSKNFLFHIPGGEAPAPKEVKGNNPEKPIDTGKPDYAKPASREVLYKKVDAAIARLRQSPDKKNWAIAKDLESRVNLARKNEKMKLETPEQAAKDLHDRLNNILHPPMSDAEGAKLVAKLDALEPRKKAPAPKAKAKPGEVVFDADSITAQKPNAKKARADALADARSFGMVDLLKPKEAPKPAPEVTANLIDAPKPPVLVKAIPPTDVPDKVRVAARNFVSTNPGFTGEKYLASSDGKMWKATVKRSGDRATTKWESVSKSA